jgi:hypothetical protein
MGVRFANEYIERLFAEKDIGGWHHLVSVMERERTLPEEFWLFSSLLEWLGSARSGVWQYYDELPEEKFERMTKALEAFGFAEVAEHYRFGRAAWNQPDQAEKLDEWIDRHEQEVESAVLDLVSKRKECSCDRNP